MTDDAALASLRAFLDREDLALNSRLPPERELCAEIGMTRAALRKALDVLEAEGQIWRHVGRGTFIGPRPVERLDDLAFLSSRSNPAKVMEARLHVEPEMSRLAAMHATDQDYSQLRTCIRRSRAAKEWRVYEAWDNKFHAAIAAATHNHLLINLVDTLHTVRRAIVWAQPRSPKSPPPDHLSFREHDEIFDAIAARDGEAAADAMRRHLITVRDRVLASWR